MIRWWQTVWSNGEMMIGRGKQKTLREESVQWHLIKWNTTWRTEFWIWACGTRKFELLVEYRRSKSTFSARKCIGVLNEVDLFSAKETYSISTGFQGILTQHSTCVRQSVALPFQRHLSRCVYIKYKISYPAAWNSVFGTNTNRTDNGLDVFFVPFQNWSYEISFRIPTKWLWNDSCSGGSSSVAKFRRARILSLCKVKLRQYKERQQQV